MEWHLNVYEIICGGIGGLMYAVFKDELYLPKQTNGKIVLGFLRAILLGMFVGFVVDTHVVFSALMGFSFNDVIKAIEKRIQKTIQGGDMHVGQDIQKGTS